MTIIRLDKLLNSSSSGRLDKIIRRARQNQDLTDLIKSSLDKDLAEVVISTTVQKDELVVVAASSAWAARLRFETDALLRAARAHVPEVARCQVRVARQESGT